MGKEGRGHRDWRITAGWGQAHMPSRRFGAVRSSLAAAPGASGISTTMRSPSSPITQRPVGGQCPGRQSRHWLQKSRSPGTQMVFKARTTEPMCKGQLCGSLQRHLHSSMGFSERTGMTLWQGLPLPQSPGASPHPSLPGETTCTLEAYMFCGILCCDLPVLLKPLDRDMKVGGKNELSL